MEEYCEHQHGGAGMSLLDRLFKKASPSLPKANGEAKTSGELIAEVTGGSNLVEGKQPWEYTSVSRQ
jgi:hypothetical protein